MSHGSEKDKIYAKDRQFYVSEIFKPFIGENCPTLVGKPKLFFIEACRGSLVDSGVSLTNLNKKLSSKKSTRKVAADVRDGDEPSFVIPNWADVLVMYSSYEGHISYRNTVHGAWFIQTLCKELRNSTNRDLLTILTGVVRKVSYEFHLKSTNEKETPCFTSMLTKTFFFVKKNKKVKSIR